MRVDLQLAGSAVRARGRSAGFTLLEIVVAFTLMALIVAVLLRVFSGGLQGIGLAEEYSRATSIAESMLARVGADIELKQGTTNGAVDERFNWTVNIQPHVLEEAGAADIPGATPSNILPVSLMEVVVDVVWSENGRDRRVKLTTLRTGPRT